MQPLPLFQEHAFEAFAQLALKRQIAIHQGAELLRQLAVPTARSLCRYLDGDGLQARVVTFCVAPIERLELVCLGHGPTTFG